MVAPKPRNSARGFGSSSTCSCACATSSSLPSAASTSDPYAIATGMSTRCTVSASDQLTSWLVISSLFGTTSFLRSNAVINVARIRIFETVPETPPTVTVSPTRIGRSNSRIRPETKFAKISWSPKPSPRPTAATSHCTFDHPIPIALKASTPPISVIAYFAIDAIA